MSALYDELSAPSHKGFNYGKEAQQRIDQAIGEAAGRGEIVTGYRTLTWSPPRSWGATRSIQVPVFGRDPKAAEEDLRKEQARLAGIQQSKFEAQQKDIAKQLQILQNEKSAVSKMSQEYTNMLTQEADRRKKAQEDARLELLEQRRSAQVSAQASAANRLMEGRSANLQIRPAGGAPRTGGTQQFRRRALQQGTTSAYKGLSTIASGMVNV